MSRITSAAQDQDAGTWTPPFQWLAASHPFQSVIESLTRTVEADRKLARWEALPSALPPCASGTPLRPPQVHAEFKAVPSPQSACGWQIERVYWSLQVRDHATPLGIRARTLVWHRKAPAAADPGALGRPLAPEGWTVPEGLAGWHELPEDPRLADMGHWVQAHGSAAAPGDTLTVLRYVPLRRLTFLRRGTGGALIGKFRRKSRHAEAQRLLQPIADAVDRGEPGFAVARPGPVVPESALYFQSSLPGEDLAQVIAPRDGHDQVDLMIQAIGKVGRLTAALHRLPLGADQVARQDNIAAQMDHALLQLQLLDVVQPAFRAEWRALGRAVSRRPQDLSGSSVRFCHGDLVCSQWLVAPRSTSNNGHDCPHTWSTESAHWALTDFDLCRLGDPCRDLAHLIASLDDDLPALHTLSGSRPAEAQAQHQHCTEALLVAYQQASGKPLGAERLTWQLVCADIHQLWLMVTKDRYRPQAFTLRLERALGRLALLDRPGAAGPGVLAAASMP